MTILYQLSQSETTSCNSFRDSFITSFDVKKVQRAIKRKMLRAILEKNNLTYL